jgi:O-acetyl-ADP-ribose deacetylase (regulator of RNase III)
MRIEYRVTDIADQPQTFDAVVNSANSNLRLGSGVAGAIHRAAGPELEAYCQPLAPLAPGKAIITPGFKLLNPWIIHVRAAHYLLDEEPEAVMAEVLQSMFQVAGEHKIKALAMPFIGTGVFKFPYEVAADLIIKAIQNDAPQLAPDLWRLKICLTSQDLESYFHQAIERNDHRPKTVEAAVQYLLETLPENSLRDLAALKENELIQTHFGLSLYLRNGLMKENKALVTDTGKRHLDDASGVIVEALWNRLKQQGKGQSA